MKKFITVALLMNAVLLAGRFWQELEVAEGGGAALPLFDDRFCADANGDGAVDLSDPVTVLNYLFLGSAPPYCIAQGVSLEDRFAALESRIAAVEGQFPVDWNALANVPDGFADNVDDTLSEEEVVGILEPAVTQLQEDMSTVQGQFPVDWGSLPNVPTGVADGIDDDALSNLACADGEVAKWDAGSGEWVCTEDLVDEFGVTFVETNTTTGLDEYIQKLTGIEFVRLPGGTFDMGSPDSEANRRSDEGPVHAVTLSPFLIAKYEVTQAQWESVMGTNPSFNTGDDQRPVEQVSWDDIQEFVHRTGLRLPSEAQWEYAARGGTRTAFSFGDECNAFCNPCAIADDFMWWCGNSENNTHPVGTKLPNPFGLYDMHGNVDEWCLDFYDRAFYGKPEALLPNPVATGDGGSRVIRSGSFPVHAFSCRSALRSHTSPDAEQEHIGFRPVRPLH